VSVRERQEVEALLHEGERMIVLSVQRNGLPSFIRIDGEVFPEVDVLLTAEEMVLIGAPPVDVKNIRTMEREWPRQR